MALQGLALCLLLVPWPVRMLVEVPVPVLELVLVLAPLHQRRRWRMGACCSRAQK